MNNVECSAITYIGLVRGKNEDNYYINGKYKTDFGIDTEGYIDNAPRNSYLYAVCDGMGGEKLGELASMIAVKTLARYQSTDINSTLMQYVQTANKFICDEIDKNNGTRIGTTLALLYIHDGKAFSCNVGDSRVYFLRDGDLFLMTEDHTEAQRLVKMGMLSQEDASTHKSRNRLTQHLGIFPEEEIIEPFISQDIQLAKNDMFVICSDGLTDMVSEDDIADCLSMEDIDTTTMVKKLAAATQTNGAKDNATIIIVKIL